jgi:hypothetical protein
VIGDPALLARLSELARSRVRAPEGAGWSDPGGTPHDPAGPPPVPLDPDLLPPGWGSLPAAVGVEAFLPGGEWRDERGAVFVHERLRSDVEKRRPHWGRLEGAPENEPDLTALCAVGLERALFLDLETGGLSSSPVFLAGTMHWNGADFILRQYFARHY